MIRRARSLPALLAATVLVAGAAVASAHDGGHGGDDGGKHRGGQQRGHDTGGDHGHGARERVFTLDPNPAANPEGIAYDRRTRAFYVSITGDGAIYRGTLGDGTVSPFLPGATGRAAVGIEVHRGKLYVAGGPTGTITVYDLATKEAVGTFETGTGGFLNDLVVTRGGDVYVTDSFRPTLWHVTREQVRAGGGTPQALDVSGGIPYVTGKFNLNGIVARGSGRLVSVQTQTGKLFAIDLTGDGDAIAAIHEINGATVRGGDGMILDRGRLVVVQGDPAQLSFVKLRHGRATVLGTQTSAILHGPSTVDRAGGRYLLVNADFANKVSPPFTVAGLPARGARGHH